MHSSNGSGHVILRFYRFHPLHQRLDLLGFKIFRSTLHRMLCLNA